MKRKTRITKEEIIAYREDKKIPSYKRKKDLKPGPWTNLEPTFEVKAKLKLNKSIVSSIGDFYGSYQDNDDWYEKGWYPIIFNIEVNDLELLKKHGLDLFLAAYERALNELVDKDSKSLYGDVVLLKAHTIHAEEEDPTKRFISCEAKTNKKHIKGFFATRQGEYKVLE